MRYEDLVRLAADLGVDGLDLTVYWFPSTSDDFLLPLRLLAYRSGIDIQSIGIRTNMCRATPELQDAEVASLKPWLDVAEKLGARHIRVFGGSPPRGIAEDQAVGRGDTQEVRSAGRNNAYAWQTWPDIRFEAAPCQRIASAAISFAASTASGSPHAPIARPVRCIPDSVCP